MNNSYFGWASDHKFKPFLLWHLMRLFVAIALGAIFVGLFVETNNEWCLVAIAMSVMLGCGLTYYYNRQTVLIHRSDIIFYQGGPQPPIVIPLELSEIDVRQSLLGYLFDYGSLWMMIAGKETKLGTVSNLRLFKAIVQERHSVIRYLLAMENRRVLVHSYDTILDLEVPLRQRVYQPIDR